MIISHSKKFIFIHVFKAAGNNIRSELNNYNFTKSKKNRLLSFIGYYPPIFSTDYNGHVSAIELKKNIPNSIFDNYFKFAFVRNPWDWQVSLYHFMKQNKNHPQYNIIKNMNFTQYLVWRIKYDKKYQKDFIYDKKDNLLVDYVGRLETLQEDFNKICSILKIPKRELGKKNYSIHDNYRTYYNKYTKKLVEEAFIEDINLFNYSFE